MAQWPRALATLPEDPGSILENSHGILQLSVIPVEGPNTLKQKNTCRQNTNAHQKTNKTKTHHLANHWVTLSINCSELYEAPQGHSWELTNDSFTY